MRYFLMIEDEPEVARMQALALGKGTEIRFVSDLAEASPFLLDLENVLAVFVDEGLPDGSGRDWIIAARKRRPDLMVMIVTAHSEIPLINAANDLGVDFICKPLVAPGMRKFAKKALARAANAARADRAIGEVTSEIAIAHGLTPKQAEVLDECVRAPGRESRRATAARMGIGEHTLKAHASKIVKKTHYSRLDELTTDALLEALRRCS